MHHAHRLFTLAALATASLAPSTHAGFTVFEAAGAGAANIQTSVDAFRSAVGALNPNDGNSFLSGRREINWDGVPDGSSDPNLFPGNFFNATTPAGRVRGLSLTTPGTGFLVSADSSNPTATAPNFGFPVDFDVFSAERLFTPIGSTITDVTFFQAGTPNAATVTAFGAVFTDVEVENSTLISAYDDEGDLLFTRSVLVSGNHGLSFLGFQANAGEQIFRVRIDSGDNALLGNGLISTSDDAVVMDDFIYSEPLAVTGAVIVPEPGTVGAIALGLAWGLGWTLRRRQR